MIYANFEEEPPLSLHQIQLVMQCNSDTQKMFIVSWILNELHGHFSLCQLKYTAKPEDKDPYEHHYAEAEKYLQFAEEECCATWVKTPGASADTKETYRNYVSYANYYLYQACQRPHPSCTSSPSNSSLKLD